MLSATKSAQQKQFPPANWVCGASRWPPAGTSLWDGVWGDAPCRQIPNFMRDFLSSFLLKRQGHVTVTLQHYETHLTLTAPPFRDWCLFLFSLSLQSQMFALKCLLKGFKGSSQNWRQLPMMKTIWCYTADSGLALPCLGSDANSDTRHCICPK